MRTGESIVNLLITATGLLLSCVSVQAKGVSMPNEPIIIGVLNPVKFDHVLHRSIKVPCGRCHHDNKRKMRSEEEILAVTDGKELRCINCHNKDFSSPYLRGGENLFHINCQPCHAVGINGKRGPRKCDGCHNIKKK